MTTIEPRRTTKRNARRLGELAQNSTAERVLEAVREFLDMDVAYATEGVEGDQSFRALEGDTVPSASTRGSSCRSTRPIASGFSQGGFPTSFPTCAPTTRGLAGGDRSGRRRSLRVVPLIFSNGEHCGTLVSRPGHPGLRRLSRHGERPPPGRALDPALARAENERGIGAQFCPVSARALLEVLEPR